ncbi:NusA N-terminal domain-containing protein [Mycoplasmopsis meleagridis]|uniref:NusA N-terminal domain-containing protein n=1 Tax=Mycoplasmopsis meleagridis TaxID=29561 RepID=UPI003A882D8D
MAKKIETKELNYEKQFFKSILEYSVNHNISLDSVIDVFNQQTTKIIKKKLDQDAEIVYELDKKNKIAKLYNLYVSVVDNDPEIIRDIENNPEIRFYNITLNEAKLYYPEVKVDDIIKAPVSLSWISESKNSNIKLIAKVLFNSIVQGIKLLEKKIIYDKYSCMIGQKIMAEFVSQTDKGNWNVILLDPSGLHNVSAFLPRSLLNGQRDIKRGQKLEVVIESVEEDTKLSQIKVSLDSPLMVEAELKENIPEINEGLITIYKIQRKPGERTKVALKKTNSSNSDFDLHGAIIGINSNRINSIRSKLNNERIDIIEYSDDLITFIKNALSPAKVIDILKKEEKNNDYYVIVPKESITTAIGKKGVNASLASSLTGTHLDIVDTEKADKLGLEYDKNALSLLSQFNYSSNKKVNSNNRKERKNNLTSFDFNMDTFDKDVAAFELQEQEDNNKYSDLNFDELFKQHEKELNELEKEQEETISEELAKEEIKKDIKNYKKAKKVIEDFKIDDDLTNFGLDKNIDLSDLDDEEW